MDQKLYFLSRKSKLILYWKVKRIFIAFYTNAIIIFKENECTKIAITIFLKFR